MKYRHPRTKFTLILPKPIPLGWKQLEEIEMNKRSLERNKENWLKYLTKL